MYARCPECPSCNWVEPPAAGGMEEVVCASCGANGLAHGTDRLPDALRGLTGQHGLEVPSAYSVALGLMPLERALERMQYGPPHTPPAPPSGVAGATSGPPTTESDYAGIDPAFREAIDSRRMSVKEALERGDRETYARGLVQRHGLNADAAYMVADKRLGLREAVEQSARVRSPRKPQAQTTRPRRVTRRQAMLVLIAASLALALIALSVWRSATAPPEKARASSGPVATASTVPADPAQQTQPPAESPTAPDRPPIDTEFDAGGNLVRLVGPSPAQVLLAYCETAGPFLTPIEITEAVPKVNNTYLGTFRDPDGSPATIRIHQHWRTRRWVAGDGKASIQVLPAPDLEPGAYRVPVDAD